MNQAVTNQKLPRARGALLGLACGDAVGTTLEFKWRDQHPPVTDMVGGGVFNLEPGQWTDDTSMALCLADSLLACNSFSETDQMQRYQRWRQQGYRSSNGKCFDIGNTVSSALASFRRTGDPIAGSTAEDSAGNGSIMRLAPVVLYYHPDVDAVRKYAARSSLTTHGAAESVESCQLLAEIMLRAINGLDKSAVIEGSIASDFSKHRVQAIASGGWKAKSRDEISSSGYVIDTLEAALWCFYQTDDFRAAILLATNLARDSDTVAAVTGQIAGAFYGEDGIPGSWLEKITIGREIGDLAERLLDARPLQ